MSSLRTICRPHGVFSSMACFYRSMARVSSFEHHYCSLRPPWSSSSSSIFAVWFGRLGGHTKYEPRVRMSRQRRMVATKAANWTDSKLPYEILVYDGRGSLEEGETAEARFVKIQAAYELLIDEEKRRQYDNDNHVNPMKASQAWMEWLMKKRKAFDQRGDMAIAAWAEQQQRELNLRARCLTRSKTDLEEERKIVVKEKKASIENFHNTLRRHTLVLSKRDLMRKKAEDKKKIIGQLLAAEGLQLANDEDEK